MDKIKRAIHLDFHTMPGIYDFGKEWDAASFAETLKNAHVTYINAFAQCNLGFSYYPTKIGIPYPNMEFDMLGSLLTECHKRGIKVIAYISVGLNHEQSRRHPEWCKVDAEGKIIRGDRTGNFFRTVCYNTGYREYVLSVIKEILCCYNVDGIFCDSVGSSPCYCNKCTEKMIKEGLDIANSNDISKFAFDTTLAFSKELRSLVPKDKYLRMNGLPAQAAQEINSHGEIECLPCGGWGYDFFGAVVAYVRNLHEQVVYMTGRFQASWGDFGGFRTQMSIENDLYDALCNNAQCSIGDHMHPNGKLEPEVYKTIKEIYNKLEKYERWTDSAKYLPEIGIINNMDSHINRYGILSDSYNGIARMLGELKYNFDIINEDMDFNRFRVLILPDIVEMTDMLKEKLEAYLSLGGKVISSGLSGLNAKRDSFEISGWDYIEYCGEDKTKTAYYRTLSDRVEMRWAMYTDGILMKVKDSKTVLSAYIKPYFDRHWDGLHGYFYTPPEKETEYAAVALKDNVCHISFKIFEAYFKHCSKFHKDLVKHVLAIMLPEPILQADNMPSTARVTTTGTDKYTLIHVKVTYPEPRGEVNIIEEHNILPAGHMIRLRGIYKNIKLLPNESPMEFKVEDGYTLIKLPQITGYDMFVAEK